MRWSTLVLLPVLLSCGPPSRCFGGLKQQIFWKENEFEHLSMPWPLTAANFKNYPASDQNFTPSLRHTTNIHHLFGLFLWPVSHPGRFLERFEYRFGIVFCYRSAQAPSLQVICARDSRRSKHNAHTRKRASMRKQKRIFFCESPIILGGFMQHIRCTLQYILKQRKFWRNLM